MVVNNHFLRESGLVTCDNFPRNQGKLSHHIQFHEKLYSNSTEQKYEFTAVRCNVRKYKIL